MSGLSRTLKRVTPKWDWLHHEAAAQSEKAFGSLTPDMPKPQPEPLMPDTTELQKARKKVVAAQQGRTGRASTILTDSGSSNRLGG